MRETREDRKQRLSVKNRHAADIRWERYHAICPCPVYSDVHAYGDYEITIKSIRSGKVNTLYLHEGERRDNFYATLNGSPWKPERVSISAATRIIRKNIVKTRSGRVV
jgi:hypothetical protein